MIADYPCRWRGAELSPGRWACKTPKLRVPAAGVTEANCAKCYCRDHEPVAAAPQVQQLGTARVAKAPPCAYLGDALPVKPSAPLKKWHECDHPDQPLGAEVCSCKGCGTKCPGYKADTGEPELKQPAPPPLAPITRAPVGRRHLAYYILPVSTNGIWQRGVDALRLRWHLFTGRKVVAIAKGGPVREQIDKHEGKGPPARTLPLDPVEVVRAYLPADAEVIEVENDPTQWERVGWSALWERVLAGADDFDAILYAHAKGVTRRPASPCHRWADLLYTLALDHWPETEDALRRYPVAGSLVKRGAFFGPPSDQSKWHYSGNFFWTRAKDAREKVAAVPVPRDRWGAEAWVGIAFPLDQAGEVFGQAGPDFHLYSPDHLNRVLADHAAWTAEHRPAPVVAPPPLAPAGLRLSIIIATVGRPTVGRTWESAAAQTVPGDEIIVQHDATADWGATPRTRGQRAATGDYLLWMDDDDVYAPGSLTAIRQALALAPGRPHIFRMRRGAPFNDILPRTRAVKVGEVSTQVFVVPNDPARLGEWGTRYEGDFDFIASTLAKWPADALVWRDEVVAVWRPGDLPALAVEGPTDAGPTPPAWFAYDAGRLQDWHIWQEVVVADVYRLGAADLTGRAVLDVGGHIGAAAYQAHRLGAAVVHTYEPEMASYGYLYRNAARMPGVEVFGAAVGAVVTDGFRSGRPFDAPPATCDLDEAVARCAAASPDGRVALVKIDCEGGEWPALVEARDLSKVDRITGEWHRVDWRGRKWGPDDLAGILGPHGFAVAVGPTVGDCGLFTAVRRSN